MPKIFYLQIPRTLKLALVTACASLLFGIFNASSASAMSGGEIIQSMNQQRAAAGLAPLHENAQLDGSAAAKARDMAAKGYWAHNAPDGTEPWAFFYSSGYSFEKAGENLAKNFTTTDSVVSGWMNSPGHRANVLGASFYDVGVAVIPTNLAGEDTILVVAHYAKPRGQVAPVPNPAPAPAPTPKPVAQPTATPVAAATPTTPTPVPTPVSSAPVADTPPRTTKFSEATSKKPIATILKEFFVDVTYKNVQKIIAYRSVSA